MYAFASFDGYSIVVSTAFVLAFWIASRTTWNLYFSPLAKFPGPKLAAWTRWYEFYFDCVQRGRFAWEIQRLHEIYGPIVRIAPDEVHIEDPNFYDELYTGAARPRDKPAFYYWRIGKGSMFGALDHKHHKMRRGVLNPFFSKASILKVEGLIQRKVDLWARRVRENGSHDRPVSIGSSLMAMLLDIISFYAFGIDDWDLLKTEDFGSKHKKLVKATLECMSLVRAFPYAVDLLEKAPDWIGSSINPTIKLMLELQGAIRVQVRRVLDFGMHAPPQHKSHRTLFEEVRDSELPPAEKEVERIKGEAFVVVGAGGDAACEVMTHMTYHLLTNPTIHKRLKADLEAVQPDSEKPIPLLTLEKIPLMRNVVTEGLRISAVAPSRFGRIAPYENLRYGDWVIPSGYVVSMTQHFTQLSPKYFESPLKFDPDRWARADADGTRFQLDKCNRPFSGGNRNCIGQDLAKAEIYLTMAKMVRTMDLELYETEWDDVQIVADCFVGYPKVDSRGVRVHVLNPIER